MREAPRFAPWFEEEPTGAPLAPICSLCTARHRDGDPCIVVRVLPPGVTEADREARDVVRKARSGGKKGGAMAKERASLRPNAYAHRRKK